MKRTLALVLALVTVLLTLSSCAVVDTAREIIPALQTPTPVPTARPTPEPTPVPTPRPTPPPEPVYENVRYGYYGQRLTDTQKRIYNRMVGEIDQMLVLFKFYNLDTMDIHTAYYAVKKDHPEFYWIDDTLDKVNKKEDQYGTQLTAELKFVVPLEEAKASREAVNAHVAELVAQTEGMSELDAALFFHDEVLRDSVYDWEGLEKHQAEAFKDLNAVNHQAHTPYGIFVNHVGVCDGFCTAFQWLMLERGMDCIPLSGRLSYANDSNHQWVCACIDGQYGFIDPTENEQSFTDVEGVELISHVTFGLTAEELLKTHEGFDPDDYPDCSDVPWEYHRAKGYLFETYDAAAVREAVLRQKDDETISLKFANKEALDAAFKGLMESSEIFRLLNYSGTIQYRTEEDSLMLLIFPSLQAFIDAQQEG